MAKSFVDDDVGSEFKSNEGLYSGDISDDSISEDIVDTDIESSDGDWNGESDSEVIVIDDSETDDDICEDISKDDCMVVDVASYRTEVKVLSLTGYRYTTYNRDIPESRLVKFKDEYYRHWVN